MCLRPVVAAGASVPAGTRSNRLPEGLHLLRRAPATPSDDVTMVMPSVNAKVMDLFLRTLQPIPLDQRWRHRRHDVTTARGWHDERALTVPDNVDLGAVAALAVPNSTCRRAVFALYLDDERRSPIVLQRPSDDTEAIIDACCASPCDRPAIDETPDRMRTALRLSMAHEGDFIGSLPLSPSIAPRLKTNRDINHINLGYDAGSH